MAALGNGVAIAGLVAAGVGLAGTRGTSAGVNNDTDDWTPASGSNPLPVSARGTPLPGVMRARHLPPSWAARTANAPSADVYVNAADFAVSSWRPASGGAISLRSPTTCCAVSGDFVTARDAPCISIFAGSPSSKVKASALLLMTAESRRSS